MRRPHRRHRRHVHVSGAIGRVLDLEEPLTPADVIVALSGDASARTETAVDLWKRKLAPIIIFAGASVDPSSVASGQLVKREAMVLEENARGVANLMKARGLTSAILVTSPYHQRRASNLFDQEFGPAKLTFANYPARDPQWDPNTWWLHEPARTLSLVELAKLSAEVATTAFH